ncbi:hypothetical protein HOLleu_28721 [Holothuria leucospilota]|uniref:Uncharacterized protein n=1 Tax=Holothuria leucospilota TaxID=206669 RepID=A0A9Q1BMM8_HOLLE|nr:hypothetical protein HOLleu_28721 [Holothuria leucospilota]
MQDPVVSIIGHTSVNLGTYPVGKTHLLPCVLAGCQKYLLLREGGLYDTVMHR